MLLLIGQSPEPQQIQPSIPQSMATENYLRFVLSAMVLSLPANHRIDEAFNLLLFYHCEAIFLHAEGDFVAVLCMMIAAFHQREKNMVVDPTANAAHSGVRKNIEPSGFEHTEGLLHGLVRIRIVMEALDAGHHIKAAICIASRGQETV